MKEVSSLSWFIPVTAAVAEAGPDPRQVLTWVSPRGAGAHAFAHPPCFPRCYSRDPDPKWNGQDSNPGRMTLHMAS